MIQIFDTTLRDGEQSPGCSMNLQEKLQMARGLERLGVDAIEAGFAAASPGDFESIVEIAKAVRKPRITSLARCRKADIDKAAEALASAERKRIHIFIATSDIHMEYKLKMSREEVLKSIDEHVRYAKEKVDDIEFSAEDATRTDPDFLVQVYGAALAAGATVLNIPDTVGYTAPKPFYDLVKRVADSVRGEDVILSVHAHNDLGLALSNTLAAIEAGARQVEVTLNGIGERCGNAALEEVVMALHTRMDLYGETTNIVTEEIMPASKLLSQITGIHPAPTKPIVGANAFAHESGIHQDGVLKHKATYEILDPKIVGRRESEGLVLGKHSGKHALGDKLASLGYELSEGELADVFHRFKVLADQKKTVYDTDLHALVLGEFKAEDVRYRLKDYHALTNTGADAKVIIEIQSGEEAREFVGTGKGPIDAAFEGMSRVVAGPVTLKDFKIIAISQDRDAQGEATISLDIDGKTYPGKGISNDIIQASIEAYIDALNRREVDCEDAIS